MFVSQTCVACVASYYISKQMKAACAAHYLCGSKRVVARRLEMSKTIKPGCCTHRSAAPSLPLMKVSWLGISRHVCVRSFSKCRSKQFFFNQGSKCTIGVPYINCILTTYTQFADIPQAGGSSLFIWTDFLYSELQLSCCMCILEIYIFISADVEQVIEEIRKSFSLLMTVKK